MEKIDDDQKVIFYIPIGINTRIDYFPGFGKEELKQAMIGLIFGAIVAVAIYLYTGLTLGAIITAFVTITGSILVTTKSSINISVVDYIAFAMNFSKSKKTYAYRQLKEWE